MKYSTGIIIAVLLLVGGWYAISSDKTSTEVVREETPLKTETAKLSIATSFYPLQFALERIVGDLGTVTNIGEGKDPHDFEPTTQNILVLQKADLVVLQGADFEPWGDDVIARLESDDVPVVLATENIELHAGGDQHHGEEADAHDQEINEDAHDLGAYNPHTWLDPVLFSQTVANLAEAVAAIDPENADTYAANASTLRSELAELDTAYKTRLTDCALSEVIISHDAFGYLADRYGFAVHPIAGLSTHDTPSATTLAELKGEAEKGIGAILLEQNSISAYGETLARETGLQTLSINPVAYVVPVGEDYLSLMRGNLSTFATALQCHE